RLHSWSTVDNSVLGEGCDIGRRARVRNAILDKFVTIEPGAVLGYDLEHDKARGHTVTPGGIVAVAKGETVRA
ncbi:MAG: glucose-1-phosphate adenylyltransferase, partial [Myxococcales bacterium]|nr:glucose-1-phosphate adenylyltransferase [Myxococcales bacterium]